jgi:ABC-type glutathione transport system ATPase component
MPPSDEGVVVDDALVVEQKPEERAHSFKRAVVGSSRAPCRVVGDEPPGSGQYERVGSGHGLCALDLEIEQGEVFGFLGPNGAGKSTAMRLLVDLIKPTSGSASVLGLDTREHSLEIRRRVGFLPGDFALYPKLTGARVLDYLADLRGRGRSACPGRAG